MSIKTMIIHLPWTSYYMSNEYCFLIWVIVNAINILSVDFLPFINVFIC